MSSKSRPSFHGTVLNILKMRYPKMDFDERNKFLKKIKSTGILKNMFDNVIQKNMKKQKEYLKSDEIAVILIDNHFGNVFDKIV